LVTGAAAGSSRRLRRSLRYAYDGIKLLFIVKYDRVALTWLERDPASAAKQNILKEDLEKSGSWKRTKITTPG